MFKIIKFEAIVNMFISMGKIIKYYLFIFISIVIFSTQSLADSKSKVFFIITPKHSSEASAFIRQIERELSDSYVVKVASEIKDSNYIIKVLFIFVENINGNKVDFIIKPEIIHRSLVVSLNSFYSIRGKIVSGKKWDESVKGEEPNIVMEDVFDQPSYEVGPYGEIDYNKSAKLFSVEIEKIIKKHNNECNFISSAHR